jgi:hypothetical protein
LNITVTNTKGPGFITVWPQGGTFPTVSTLNYVAGQTIANAAIVPSGTGGGISVVAGVHGTDLIIDINGYFSSTLGTATDTFFLTNNSAGTPTMFLDNMSGACAAPSCGLLAATHSGNAVVGISATNGDGVLGTSGDSTGAGVHGQLTTGVANSAAVFGEHQATGGNGIGVHGSHAGNGWGIFGESKGSSGSGAAGVLGEASSTHNGTAGVSGHALGTTGATYGVYGVSESTGSAAAGVFGANNNGATKYFAISAAGVRGESNGTGYGVLGSSRDVGVAGVSVDSTGAPLAVGDVGNGSFAFFGHGDYGGTGAKFFVEPHPIDASKVIRYVCLEGPESGTYFRGSAQIVSGQAVINVPEDFRIVTDTEGLTVQLTPVGDLATMAVVGEDLNQIVVKSNRDVRFHYMVNGVRKAFKDHQAIDSGNEYMPRSASEAMAGYLTPEAKRRLIANGTYNEDGSVNLTTAERLGWTKIWADREQAAKEAAAKASLERPGTQQTPQRKQ